ncbi:MAG TPA: HigA family addiction module antitoxin [Lamprocystis sp. (in: g-proteobacteria)]|nr:HigA family addiction module antitoxin [Lamprocystis sp. (in: g-proteobacteria)]
MSRLPTTTESTPALKLPPIHPGEVLCDELAELGLSANAMALALDVPSKCIAEILDGMRAVNADTALRLARYFGTSPRFWLNLQLSYDLAVAERERGESITRRVHPRAA